MKQSYVTTTRLKSGEDVPGNAQTDFVRDAVGEIHAVASDGTAAKVATSANINAVLNLVLGKSNFFHDALQKNTRQLQGLAWNQRVIYDNTKRLLAQAIYKDYTICNPQ